MTQISRIGWWFLLTLLAGCESHGNKPLEGDLVHEHEFVEKTNRGSFVVHLSTADSVPAPIGRYHNWSIVLTDENQVPVQTASIAVSGGMPTHGYGLPTTPQVTQNLGNGHFLIEGMLFNMSGQWLVRINIAAEGKSDVVDFTFPVNS